MGCFDILMDIAAYVPLPPGLADILWLMALRDAAINAPINYFDLLHGVSEYIMVLPGLASVLLLAAILDVARVFCAACLSAACFICLALGCIVLEPMLLLLLGGSFNLGFCALTILFLMATYTKKIPTLRFPWPFRVVLAALGLGILLIVALGEKRSEVSSCMVRRAILAGDAAGLKHWRYFSDDVWKFMAERPRNSETLDLIQAVLKLRKLNSGYQDEYFNGPIPLDKISDPNAWTLLFKYPASEKRTDILQTLVAENCNVPAYVVATLHDQNDTRGLETVIHSVMAPKCASLKTLLSMLFLAKRTDVVDAVEAIATTPPSKDRQADEADPKGRQRLFLSAIDLEQLLSDRDLLAKYIRKGAPLDARDYYGKTLLLRTLERGRFKMAHYLVSEGADTRIGDKHKRTALFYTVMYNDEELFPQLLETSEDPAATDADGMTPLHWAAWTGNYDMVRALLAKGVPVDGPNPDTPSPLFFAVIGGGPEALELLLDRLDHDAPMLARQTDDRGKTPFALAVHGRNIHGSDIINSQPIYAVPHWSFGFKSKNGADNWQTLHAQKNRTVALLLAAGADAYRKTGSNSNILHAFFGEFHKNPPHRINGEPSPSNWSSLLYRHNSLADDEYGAMLDAMAPLGEIGSDRDMRILCGAARDAEICQKKLRPFVSGETF